MRSSHFDFYFIISPSLTGDTGARARVPRPRYSSRDRAESAQFPAETSFAIRLNWTTVPRARCVVVAILQVRFEVPVSSRQPRTLSSLSSETSRGAKYFALSNFSYSSLLDHICFLDSSNLMVFVEFNLLGVQKFLRNLIEN